MRHLLPQLELDLTACLLDTLSQPETVITKNLASADLNQDRRQTAQVGEERRNSGVGKVHMRGVACGILSKTAPAQHCIMFGAVIHARAGQGEVNPWAAQCRFARQAKSSITKGDE